TSAPFTKGETTVAPPACRTLYPTKQFALCVAPEYKPHTTPALAPPNCRLPASITNAPPNSTASIAVNVVCPSNPLPPVIVSPAALKPRCDPGSVICQIRVFSVLSLKLSVRNCAELAVFFGRNGLCDS